jgi:cell division protein FtsW
MITAWAKRHLNGDPVIWGIVLALSVISILVVYSATGSLAYQKMGGDTEYYLFRHTKLVLLSLAAMWISHKIDYRYFSKLSRIALWVSVPLLLITWLFGQNINDASRWLTIPIINQAFQPSDFAKLALIAGLASMLSKKQHSKEDLKQALISILGWCGVIVGLIGMTDASTAVLLLVTCMLLLYIGRVPMKYLLALALVGILAGTIALAVGQRAATVKSRIASFISADAELPFQAQQAHIAIATGGVTGKGPGQSDQRNYLPSSFADYVYAIIIEEYGLVGGTGVLFLYLALLYRGIIAVAKSEKAFGGLLSAGLSFALVLQAMVNMGVVVGLGPITGLPLPLVSMGGTSLLFTGISVGIILSVSRSAQDAEAEEELVVEEPVNSYKFETEEEIVNS